MSLTLTAKQHRIAAAICSDDNAPLSQGEIAAQLGVHPAGLSTTIKTLSMKMGLVAPTETGHVSRLRLVIAARKAGGFDQLAASMGLLNRDRETVQ
jgi:DNA-binding MarR family transcriptional regulator